jgi:hypothetical protein
MSVDRGRPEGAAHGQTDAIDPRQKPTLGAMLRNRYARTATSEGLASNSVARDDNASRPEEGLAMAAAWRTSASNGFFGANHLIFRTGRHHEQA